MAKILGLELEAEKTLTDKINRLNREIVHKNNIILGFIGMSFIDRFKFLFTGKVDV